MKLFTPERAEFNASDAVRLARSIWLSHHPICWFCPGPSQGVHEIGTEGNRVKFLDAPCSWAAACNHCNQNVLTDYSLWPVVRQLAQKLRYDPDTVDLDLYNRLRGRGPNAITLGEVLSARNELLALEEV